MGQWLAPLTPKFLSYPCACCIMSCGVWQQGQLVFPCPEMAREHSEKWLAGVCCVSVLILHINLCASSVAGATFILPKNSIL
jgi:hypothetical protein